MEVSFAADRFSLTLPVRPPTVSLLLLGQARAALQSREDPAGSHPLLTVDAAMPLIVYEAILSDRRNLAQVRAARRAIEAVGGWVQSEPPTKEGLVVVILALPKGYAPKQFVPGLPFYPV